MNASPSRRCSGNYASNILRRVVFAAQYSTARERFVSADRSAPLLDATCTTSLNFNLILNSVIIVQRFAFAWRGVLFRNLLGINRLSIFTSTSTGNPLNNCGDG